MAHIIIDINSDIDPVTYEIDSAAKPEWSEGDKVEAGEPGTEDYDRGIVHAVREDGLYLVGWESGVSTPHAADELRPRT